MRRRYDMEPTWEKLMGSLDGFYELDEIDEIRKASNFLDGIDIEHHMRRGEDVSNLFRRINDTYPYPGAYFWHLSLYLSLSNFEKYLQCRYGADIVYKVCVTLVSHRKERTKNGI